MIYFLLSGSKLACAFVFVYSQKYFSFIVWASPPQILLLFFFTVSCCNIPFGRSFREYFLWILKTSFLALAFSLQMSKSKIMVHCWCFGKGGVDKGVCSLHTLGKSTHFTCSVRDLVCTNSSSLLASTRRRHWNSKQAFWKLSVFSDPFPHIQSKQLSQGTSWTWCKFKYEWWFCPRGMNIDLFCQQQGYVSGMLWTTASAWSLWQIIATPFIDT